MAKEQILKKAREIILAKSDGSLSLQQRRMFNLLLFKAMKAGQAQAEQGGIHRLMVSEMMDYVGGQSWERLDESLKALSSLSLTLDYVDDDGQRNTSRVHYISYHMTHSQDGWVYFAFDPLLLKFVYYPKVYAMMSMADLGSFRSVSGAELYEILSLRVRKQVGNEWEVSVDEFREIMRIKPEDYTRFDNLRARVIEPAVDEVNELAPFRVEVSYKRSGRGGKVSSIVFSPTLKGLSVLSGRDASMGSVMKNTSKNSVKGNQDLFGYSDGEHHGGVTEDALQAAMRLLGGKDPLPMLDLWKDSMAGRTVLRPDKSFLSWLEARIASESGGELEGMDMDSVDALINTWIDAGDNS